MKREDEIFAEAIELPPDARSAYLDRECAGDGALRMCIEDLLAAHDAAGDFLREAPRPRPARGAEGPGAVIGHYRLLEKLGEGGCGAIYLAEQKVPVQRRVALKVIKVGMDTRAVITRFEGERQALALMDHPDIARVFDAGETEAGRPYFVMELVEGVPITRFCDEQRLSVAARLELFARVCLALQHAHQKGIIHRDVKPSNVLVAWRDGVACPKVIDFGIAKATQGRLTEETLVTGVDQFMGTPAYMSPEQADRREGDVDTRSDVYSLGVLLYELLTGRLPFDTRVLSTAGVDEFRRLTREVEPPRPSTRVASLDDADLAGAARDRATRPKQLSAALTGDLDWIVMRCLEKDRERRYGSARELAEDLGRHLNHEPVRARPPSAGYRLGRFVARNRLACGSAATVAAALVIGTVVSVRQAVRATRAERAATAARDVARVERDAANSARADALRRQDQAEDLLAFMVGEFRGELQKIGKLQLLDQVGEKAMAYFAALPPRDLTDAALARQAKVLTQIGEIRLEQTRYPEAMTAFTAAYERAAALVERHPRNGDMVFERGQAEYWLGFVARRRGDHATQRRWLVSYRDTALALTAIEGATARAQGELTWGHHNLAVLDLEAGALQSAVTGFTAERAALGELLRTTPEDAQLRFRLADNCSWLGLSAELDGRYAEALAWFRRMAAAYDELTRREPGVARWRLQTALGAVLVGRVEALGGRYDEALAEIGRGERLLAALTELDPQNKLWRVHRANAQLEQVSVLVARGDAAAAGRQLAPPKTQLEELHRVEPSFRMLANCLACAWRLEALLALLNHDLDRAGRVVGRAVELNDQQLRVAHSDVKVLAEAARARLLAGRIAAAEGRPEQAREHWTRALDIVSPRYVDANDWRLLEPAAQALALLGRRAEARPLARRLADFGFHTPDPLAASLLDSVSLDPSDAKQP